MIAIQIVIGAAMLITGGCNIIFRGSLVARHRARSPARHAQSPYAHLVVGGIVALAGALMLIASLVEVI